MKTKICTKCEKEKDVDGFSWKKKSEDTRQSKCKLCYREHRNQWYSEHKDSEVKTILAYRKRKVKEIKEWYQEYKRSLSCSKCNESRSPCLQFHHINPKDKDDSVGTMVAHGCSIRKIKKEIAKCIVLCANCHAVEHSIWE
jgi:hypothetical protein